MINWIKINRLISALLFLVMLPLWNVLAVAPSPDVTIKWKEQGIYKKQMEKFIQAKLNGLCSPSEQTPKNSTQNLLATSEITDTINILVLCVDFSDHKFSGTTYGQSVIGKSEQFDTLLFSDRRFDFPYNETGSMTEYYLENSYGKFYIKGKTYGWLQAPEPYTYYVGDDNGLSNSRILARQAVQIASGNPYWNIDFSDYDNDGDNIIDGLIIIHAGPGRETVADTTFPAIWSHKFILDQTLTLDGVEISDYVMAPEEIIDGKGARLSPIGVFCHEFGHILGLPDLYD
ncbi:MAG: M6 family metalloprotease domain-containing protein, partial [candidate division Zixibacteria bacterium]|nr:M6 family metalloprotease domain-containing protein [candidate division Zixibacteria bacterium]